MTETDTAQDFQALLEYLKRARGFDFTGYKPSTLQRRVLKRMHEVGAESFTDYIDVLEVHSDEFSHLFDTILINLTGFFRDEAAWAYVSDHIVPRILEAREGEPIRVWSAACASGEEAYTLAMMMCEAMGADEFRRRVKVYATDVDDDALAKARQGSYTSKELSPLSTELREKYFQEQGTRFVFRNDLRRSVIFGRHDLVQDAPISRLDLLVCRNALMYFNTETQSRILARQYFALNDDGFLFLGRAEMLLTHANLFVPDAIKHRVFKKVPKVELRDRLLVLAQAGSPQVGDHLAGQLRLREAALDSAPVAQLVIDGAGEVAGINDQARRMFGLSLEDIGRPLQDLEIAYRPLELQARVDQAYADRAPLTVHQVERTDAGVVQLLDVQVVPLLDLSGGMVGVSITFADVTRFRRLQVEVERSRQELETAYEELQSTNEELETTNEELQSTIEELETTNEELQSTNEELETMNEELQSTNEELETMNDELRVRTAELNHVNLFMESVLTSLRVGVVVLNTDLIVTVWNGRAQDMWGLRAEEVVDRPLMSLDFGLQVETLRRSLIECAAGRLQQFEDNVAATNRLGRGINCRVVGTTLYDENGSLRGVVMLMEELPTA